MDAEFSEGEVSAKAQIVYAQVQVPPRSGRSEAIKTRSEAVLRVYESYFKILLRLWVNAVMFAPGGAAQQLISMQQTYFGDSATTD